MPVPQSGDLSAILPCNDLDASEAFYRRLGFGREAVEVGASDDYRILFNAHRASLHLTRAVEGWLIPGRNPFGFYLYIEDVDAVAATVRDLILEKSKVPEDKPWGMYEFNMSDPDETLVRVGWPTRLRAAS